MWDIIEDIEILWFWSTDVTYNSSIQEEAPSAVRALRNGRMWDSPGSSSLPTGLS